MKRKRLILCVSSFLAQLSICMANFALIYYMRDKFLLQPSQIGIASSIYTVTYFLSCLAFSPLFAHLKRKAKAFIAFLGMAFTDTFIILTESTAILYLMLALYGVAMSFLWPNIEDWITEGESGVALAKATGSFNLSWFQKKKGGQEKENQRSCLSVMVSLICDISAGVAIFSIMHATRS